MYVKLGVPSAGISCWMLKIPTVSFTKSRRAIAGTMNEFQILALTTTGKAKANHPV